MSKYICRQRVGDDLSLRHHFLPCWQHVGQHVADNRQHVSVSAFLTLFPTSQMATFPAKFGTQCLLTTMTMRLLICLHFLILSEVLQEARRYLTCDSVSLSLCLSLRLSLRPSRSLCLGSPIMGQGANFGVRANFGCKLFFAGLYIFVSTMLV